MKMIPKWVQLLLREKFFNACLVHEFEMKNEENAFCMDCSLSLCFHCCPSHRTHQLLQIRRYVYQDVLRLKDAAKFLDCSFVQTYTTNGAKVVFINQRPIGEARRFKGSANDVCLACERSLQRPHRFCSIACKVQHMVSSEGQLTEDQLQNYEAASELEGDGKSTPDSILEPHISQTNSSSSTSSGTISCKSLRTAATPVPALEARPRSIGSPESDYTASVNRRKGVPLRSPLC